MRNSRARSLAIFKYTAAFLVTSSERKKILTPNTVHWGFALVQIPRLIRGRFRCCQISMLRSPSWNSHFLRSCCTDLYRNRQKAYIIRHDIAIFRVLIKILSTSTVNSVNIYVFSKNVKPKFTFRVQKLSQRIIIIIIIY